MVLQQNRVPDPKGIYKCNEGLSLLPDDSDSWACFPADDTIHHPSLLARLAELAERDQGAAVIVAGQQRGPRSFLVPMHGRVSPGRICGGQIAYRCDLLQGWSFDFPRWKDQADGHFASGLYQADPTVWRFLPDILWKFNSFEWEGLPETK
jgi:hypothetical protein